MSIDNTFPSSTTAPAFGIYSAALSIDPQNVVPNTTHCHNCFNDVTNEMKLFSCQHSICQTCLKGQSPGNNLYSAVFGPNQMCPICSPLDSKPIVNGNNFLSTVSPLIPNGNALPPPPNGNPLAYIPMNIFPPPPLPPPPPGSEHTKMEPFASLLYQPPPHINGNHGNPFQGFNGNHPGMKVHANTGPPSPNLASTLNNQITDQIHIPTTSPHIAMPVPINTGIPASKQTSLQLPTTLHNHMSVPMHTLPPNFPPNFPAIFPPLPPNLRSFPPPPILTNFQSNFSIPKPHNSSLPPATTTTLPNNSPIPPSSPKVMNTITLPTTSSGVSSSSSSDGSSLTSSINSIMCSCDEGTSATAQCMDCEDYLCESCVRAHRKVRITREHKIINITTKEVIDSSQITSPSTNSCSPSSTKSSIASPSGMPPCRLTNVMTLDDQIDGIETHGECAKHDANRLIYFCQTCGVLICKTCLIADHTHHNYGYIREMYDRFKPAIEELVSKTKVEVLLLENSVKSIAKLSESVEQKNTDCLKKLQETITQYTEALVEYEQDLREKVKSITHKRIHSLKGQKNSLEGALTSLKTISLSAEKALKEENKGEVLASRIHLVANLREKNSTVFPRVPTEDDTYLMKTSNSSVEKVLASLIQITTAPYAPLCVAEGDGLKRPKINKSCNINVTTKDRNGDACIECKEKLFVQMKSGDGHNVPVEVNNDEEGVYTLEFKPCVAGEHQLIVAIRGQHIDGSPFILPVDGGRDYAKISSSIPFSFGIEGADEGAFCRPWGICTNSEGDIIVGDRSNHRVQLFTSSGTFKAQFGTEGTRNGQFCRPAGVCTTKEDDIVVADKDNHRVQMFKKDYSFILTFGSKGSNDNQMIYPYDVTVTPDNERIVVSDSGNHRLLIFSTQGVLIAKFGYKGYLCGNFDSPRGVTVNDEGHIILTDFNVHHILVIHPNGRTAQIIGGQGSGNGQLMRPQGLAVDSMGNIVVADTRNHRIVVFHPHGHFLAKYGSHGQGPGEFDRPTAVTVLPDGTFAVVDFGNSRIQIF
ncbi:E3 ubiquitin-protein ligase TRIM71-like [Oopsacas minuta]|uniref:E3 ubiquitin-protein ligase TRIM71-like n=1 Tax=Oopsacas minuta TaxID=111878 RepID=A0AAV7JFA5_9METZ|nr:E3 ubiquitin-protein ligase TRIM71-like [Oopsacas minuta]